MKKIRLELCALPYPCKLVTKMLLTKHHKTTILLPSHANVSIRIVINFRIHFTLF